MRFFEKHRLVYAAQFDSRTTRAFWVLANWVTEDDHEESRELFPATVQSMFLLPGDLVGVYDHGLGAIS